MQNYYDTGLDTANVKRKPGRHGLDQVKLSCHTDEATG